VVVTDGDRFVTVGGVVVTDGSGLGGGSARAGAPHSVVKTTACAIASVIAARLRRRRRNRSVIVPSPLALHG
jgi:hypothetical protein